MTEIHPAAESFPMHTEDELNRLAIDILHNGLQHPIVTTPEGQVIDGRNRLAACRLVNVEPAFTIHAGDPWTYSRSVNLHTRSMTTGQRAAACALSLIAEGKRRDGRWARGSVPDDDGDTYGSVSKAWVIRMAEAGFIADWSNHLDLLIAVRDGHQALDAAHKTAKARQREKHGIPEVRWNGRIHQLCASLPWLPEAEMSRMVDSVARWGVIVPGLLLPDGTMLDGKIRQRASELADVQMRWKVFDGDKDSVSEFWWSLNMDRGHQLAREADSLSGGAA